MGFHQITSLKIFNLPSRTFINKCNIVIVVILKDCHLFSIVEKVDRLIKWFEK